MSVQARPRSVRLWGSPIGVVICLCVLLCKPATPVVAQGALPADSLLPASAAPDTATGPMPDSAVPETTAVVMPAADSLADTLAPGTDVITRQPPTMAAPVVPDSPASDSAAIPRAAPPVTKPVEVGFPVTGGDRLGARLVTVTDQNADGVADVAVGVAGCDRKAPNAGAVMILSGHSGDTLRVFEGERAGDAFGAALAVADLDGDRTGDLVIAATFWDRDTTSGIDVGKLYVYSGVAGNELYTLTGDHRGAHLGEGLAVLGDVNGDGVADLAASQALCGYDSLSVAGPACVLLLSGRDGTVIHRIVSPQYRDGFGKALASAGDVDSDGACDLLVGAYRNSHEGLLSAGAAYIVSGRTGGTLQQFHGSEMFEQFGHAVSGGQDLDGDGTPDLAVGARYFDQDGGRRGRVVLLSGRGGREIVRVDGFSAGQEFGSAVLLVPDADGDGRADLLVSASGHGRAEGVSEAVYRLSSASGSVLSTFAGNRARARLGAALDVAPDLDGDSYTDLFVGAPYHDEGGLYAGACVAVSGRSGAVLWTRSGRSSLPPASASAPGVSLMSLERLQEEVAGYDFPVYDTTEVDAAPVIRRSGAATYPASALGSNLSGWVLVKVLVLADGTAAEVEVTDDAGLGPDFREAALATVGDWSFLPASREGVEVACWAQFPIGFAPPLPPEEQRRIDSLAALTGATGLAVDSQPALPVLVGDSAATAASFFELDQVDTEPVLTAQVEPDYPTPALISRDTCTVAMRILVNGEGAVADVQVGEVSVRGKGFESAAVAAVRRWRYDPATLAGERVAVWVPSEIRFVPPQPPGDQ